MSHTINYGHAVRRAATKYRCDNCGDLHDDRCDATSCCPPSVCKVYLCLVCEEQHRCEDEANGCCEGVETDIDLPRLTAAELEAQGQMRLHCI